MNKKAGLVAGLLSGCILMLFFYTLLHEGGHGLVAILYGGKIDRLVLGFNAHIQTIGARFTPLGQALFHSAGALLPVLFVIICLSFYHPENTRPFYHISHAVLSLITTGSLLAWVILPVLFLLSSAPAGDDVTKFLEASRLSPLVVSLAALFVIAFLVLFLYWKGLPGKLKSLFLKHFTQDRVMLRKGQWVRVLAGIVSGAAVTIIIFSILMPKPVFEKSISIDVTPATRDVKLPFVLERSRPYRMNLGLKAEGILTDIQIYTDQGAMVYQNICERFTLETTLDLKKGSYSLVLTFLKNPADMEKHFKEKGYKFQTDELEQLKKIYPVGDPVRNHPVSFSVTIR